MYMSSSIKALPRKEAEAPVEETKKFKAAGAPLSFLPKEGEVLPFYIDRAESKKERTNEKSARKEERTDFL